MQHKISELCDKIQAMHEKAEQLRKMKYDTPKEQQNELMIRWFVEDLQALAADIVNDKNPHPKLKK